jgi:hypothetical protein
MDSPVKLFRNWYLVKDTNKPADYPPKAKSRFDGQAMAIGDLSGKLWRVKGQLAEERFQRTRRVEL